jgi:hypothetical protein
MRKQPFNVRLHPVDRTKVRILATARQQSLTTLVSSLIRAEYRTTFGDMAPPEALDQAQRQAGEPT